MQKTRQRVCLSGLCSTLLGLTLLFSQFILAGQANAQALHRSVATKTAKSATAYMFGNIKIPGGKVILVVLSKQWMYVFQDGQEIGDQAVTTGQPSLPTPTGIYHIFLKKSPDTFHSPWPKGSKYYYPPTQVTYAMEWHSGGYFIHDSWWHTAYGPGTNGWHDDPTYGWQWGSHGCISVPLQAAAWLYQWAPIGTTVDVVN